MIKIGDKIDGRYRIVSRVATGGMADVYEANDTVTRKVVSIKVMRSELLNEKKNIVRFRAFAYSNSIVYYLSTHKSKSLTNMLAR